MKTAIKFFLITLCYLFSISLKAQTPDVVDYYSQIKKLELSKLWRADSLATPDDRKIPFPEPLGYIGDNYQRFYIHYINVSKDKQHPYQYNVYGKTKVKENVSTFRGTITITKAGLDKINNDPNYKEGFVDCDIVLYEDGTRQSSGAITGKLTTNFYIDNRNEIHYDDLMLVSDNYRNNQCRAVWTGYKTGMSKKCNWGDFRIPDSKDLDIGEGDVSIKQKYIKNGWQNFVAAQNPQVMTYKKAFQSENAKWWE